MCPRTRVNHISNGLAEKIMDELELKNFPQTRESIGISMWELNKVHDIGMQFMGDKEDKWVVLNRLKSFTNGHLLHLLYI